MRGKWIIITLTLVLLALNGWAAYCTFDIGDRIHFSQQFREIHVGMTSSEVKDLLGWPQGSMLKEIRNDGTEMHYPTTCWYLYGAEVTYSSEDTVTAFHSQYWNLQANQIIYGHGVDGLIHGLFIIVIFGLPLLGSLFFLRITRPNSVPHLQH